LLNSNCDLITLIEIWNIETFYILYPKSSKIADSALPTILNSFVVSTRKVRSGSNQLVAT